MSFSLLYEFDLGVYQLEMPPAALEAHFGLRDKVWIRAAHPDNPINSKTDPSPSYQDLGALRILTGYRSEGMELAKELDTEKFLKSLRYWYDHKGTVFDCIAAYLPIAVRQELKDLVGTQEEAEQKKIKALSYANKLLRDKAFTPSANIKTNLSPEDKKLIKAAQVIDAVPSEVYDFTYTANYTHYIGNLNENAVVPGGWKNTSDIAKYNDPELMPLLNVVKGEIDKNCVYMGIPVGCTLTVLCALNVSYKNTRMLSLENWITPVILHDQQSFRYFLLNTRTKDEYDKKTFFEFLGQKKQYKKLVDNLKAKHLVYEERLALSDIMPKQPVSVDTLPERKEKTEKIFKL